MLAIVGALVGFHGWPGNASGETVPSVPITGGPIAQPVHVARVTRTPVAVRAVRAGARVTASRTATVGLVKAPAGAGTGGGAATIGIVKVPLAPHAPPSGPSQTTAAPTPTRQPDHQAAPVPDPPPVSAPAIPLPDPVVPGAPQTPDVTNEVTQVLSGAPSAPPSLAIDLTLGETSVTIPLP